MSADPHEALDAESVGEVVVRGVPVRFSVVGRGDRDVLLVHGSGAHRWWWYLLLPQLVAAGLRVISFDLSGHGDSGHRSEYGAEVWGEEILAVMAATGSSRPVVVGHSLGGRLTLMTADAHPDAFAGLVLIDTPLRPPPSYRAAVAAGRRQRARQDRRYHSREEAMARFRLVPPQPHPAPEVMHTLAVNGVREVEGMWTWKYDQCVMPAFYGPELLAAAATVRIPLRYVYGACSALVTDNEADFVRAHVAGEVKVVRIADSFHHLSLDRPAECAAAIIATRSRVCFP
ncbi:UNVERIFIED_CONTAM: pimeloyl-ACP methyl ester carboxylesterase [Williamsia faeni]